MSKRLSVSNRWSQGALMFLRCLSMGVLSAVILLSSSSHVAAQQPTEASEEELQLRVYRLQFVEADLALRIISEVLGSEKPLLRVSVDARTNSLVLMANKSEHDKAEELLRALDQQDEVQEAAETETSRDIEIELFWLVNEPESHSSLNASEKDRLQAVPEELADLMARKFPGDSIQMLSRSTIRLTLMSENEYVSTFQLDGVGSVLENFEHSISGTASKLASERYGLSLSLETSVKTRSETGAWSDEASGSRTQVETEFSTTAGHPVGLATARTGMVNSLFVVIVREVESTQ